MVCAPCTKAIEEGEDSRAGRWWWEDLLLRMWTSLERWKTSSKQTEKRQINVCLRKF